MVTTSFCGEVKCETALGSSCFKLHSTMATPFSLFLAFSPKNVKTDPDEG